MLLNIPDLRSGYGKVTILHGINFSIKSGQIISILGPNGAGKTTLLKTIAGHLPVISGTIEFDNVNIANAQAQEIYHQGIGYVPQEQNVFSELSVRDNLKIASMMFVDGSYRVEAVFERFPILHERRDQLASTLSGGERQTLAISSALIAKPKLLLLDEPTAGLAPLFVDRIIDWVKELSTEGMSVVWVVEQNPEKILAASSMTCLIDAGRSMDLVESEDLLKPGRLHEVLLQEREE